MSNSSGTVGNTTTAEKPGPQAAGGIYDQRVENANAVILYQIALLTVHTLAVLLAIPKIGSYISSGRPRLGWRLKRNSTTVSDLQAKPCANTHVDSLGMGGQLVPPRHVKEPRPNHSMFVAFRQFYNKYLLRSVPLGDVTRGQFSILAIWFASLMALSLLRMGGPPTSNPDRFGILAIANAPVAFLFAMKNSPLSALGKGYEKLNYLHRFAGQQFVVLGFIHGGVEIYRSIQTNGKVTLVGPYLPGLVTAVTMVIMITFAARFVRARIYQIFLQVHVVGYLTVLIALWTHDSKTHPYILICIGCLVVDFIFKMSKTHFRSATFETMPGGLTKVTVDRLGDGWRAGQHVWIRVLHGARALEKHPFTIANAPCSSAPDGSSSTLILVSKAAGDYTRALRKIAADEIGLSDNEKNTGHPTSRVAVMLEGPYGGMMYTDFIRQESVVLIAGGSGFSFSMALFEDLVGARCGGGGVTHDIIIIWTLRDLEMIAAYQDSISMTLKTAASIGIHVDFRIYNTAESQPTTSLPYLSSPSVRIFNERPDILQILSQTVESTLHVIAKRSASRGSGIGVGVCGATSMVKACRNAVSRVDPVPAKTVGGIILHTEAFGW